MARLRAQDGCPWDRKQTHESLKPYLIEESYEVLEAIDQQHIPHLREELGDLLLQVLFHGQIGSEAGTFTVTDVIDTLADKLVRRHPHVFARTDNPNEPSTADQVLSRWEDIKKEERKQQGKTESALDGVPKTLPALLRAYQVQARASRVGFDWSEKLQVLDKLDEEWAELREAMTAPVEGSPTSDQQSAIEAELGDVLFTVVNLSRFLKVNPEEALRKTINRFTDRFHFIEGAANTSGRSLHQLTLTEMDQLWDEAKRAEQASPLRSTPSAS